MAGNYQVINVENWVRAAHFSTFKNYILPHYCITAELDISKFYRRVKENGLSFSLAFIFAVARCANEIENFRYRFLDGEVVLYDEISTSFTHMDKGDELFRVVSVELADDIGSYIAAATKAAHGQEKYFPGLPKNTMLFSALPWLTYTHVSCTSSGNKDDAIPKIHWGKFFSRNEKLIMPFSVQAHHGFVDGLHMSRLFARVQEFLDEEVDA